jgi:hypothetical protein
LFRVPRSPFRAGGAANLRALVILNYPNLVNILNDRWLNLRWGNFLRPGNFAGIAYNDPCYYQEKNPQESRNRKSNDRHSTGSTGRDLVSNQVRFAAAVSAQIPTVQQLSRCPRPRWLIDRQLLTAIGALSIWKSRSIPGDD